jgi:hypothetical protein
MECRSMPRGTAGHRRPELRSTVFGGKQWRRKRVSFNLVYFDWATVGSYREIGDARAHDDLLDDYSRHHRINPWRCRYPHVFAPDKRTLPSGRPNFFHVGRDPGSLHLL